MLFCGSCTRICADIVLSMSAPSPHLPRPKKENTHTRTHAYSGRDGRATHGSGRQRWMASWREARGRQGAHKGRVSGRLRAHARAFLAKQIVVWPWCLLAMMKNGCWCTRGPYRSTDRLKCSLTPTSHFSFSLRLQAGAAARRRHGLWVRLQKRADAVLAPHGTLGRHGQSNLCRRR